MTGQVQGKVALVTGGASGIGAACAELLAREGASVAVTDIDELRGPELVAGINKAGHQAVFLHQDVTSEVRCSAAVPLPAPTPSRANEPRPMAIKNMR